MATERNTNDVLRLNVGGKHFVTRRGTLCVVEGSLLEKMFRTDSNFAPATELQGEIFLDRDPMAFGHVLNYLRDGCRLVVDLKDDEAMLQRLRADADYFGLKELVDECAKQLRIIQNNAKAKEAKEAKEAKVMNKMKAYCNDNVYEYEESNKCDIDNHGRGWKMFKIYHDSKGKTKYMFEKVTN